jgi:hypothetical protein
MASSELGQVLLDGVVRCHSSAHNCTLKMAKNSSRGVRRTPGGRIVTMNPGKCAHYGGNDRDRGSKYKTAFFIMAATGARGLQTSVSGRSPLRGKQPEGHRHKCDEEVAKRVTDLSPPRTGSSKPTLLAQLAIPEQPWLGLSDLHQNVFDIPSGKDNVER